MGAAAKLAGVFAAVKPYLESGFNGLRYRGDHSASQFSMLLLSSFCGNFPHHGRSTTLLRTRSQIDGRGVAEICSRLPYGTVERCTGVIGTALIRGYSRE